VRYLRLHWHLIALLDIESLVSSDPCLGLGFGFGLGLGLGFGLGFGFGVGFDFGLVTIPAVVDTLLYRIR
jgi:hypothetical protein